MTRDYVRSSQPTKRKPAAKAPAAGNAAKMMAEVRAFNFILYLP